MSDQYLLFTHLGDHETCVTSEFPLSNGDLVHQEVRSPKPIETMLSHLNKNESIHNSFACNNFLCILALQETTAKSPPMYSSVNKVRDKKLVSSPGYIEPEDDYDDVEIPANTESHHSKTTMFSF